MTGSDPPAGVRSEAVMRDPKQMTSARLEVVVSWCDTVIDVRHLADGQRLTLGSGRRVDLPLEHPALPADQPFVAARVLGAHVVVTAPPGVQGRVLLGDRVEVFQGGARLGAGDRARVELGDLALVFAVVEAAEAPKRGSGVFGDRVSRQTLAFAAAAHLVFLAVAAWAPADAAGLTIDRLPGRDYWVESGIVPRQPPEDPWSPATTEANEATGAGDTQAPVERAPTPVARDTPRDTAPGADPEAVARRAKARADSVAEATRRAIDTQMASVIGGATLGNDAQAALDGLFGTQNGVTAGLSGVDFDLAQGPPGGDGLTVGLSTGVAGIPGLDRGPRGRGPGRPGTRVGQVGTREPPHRTPRAVPGPPKVEGGLTKDQVRREVQRHRAEIRYCYERRLNLRRDLEGKVAVRFIVGGTGDVLVARATDQTTLPDAEVGACLTRKIMRWRFPRPQGGGQVVVTYPFMFRPV